MPRIARRPSIRQTQLLWLLRDCDDSLRISNNNNNNTANDDSDRLAPPGFELPRSSSFSARSPTSKRGPSLLHVCLFVCLLAAAAPAQSSARRPSVKFYEQMLAGWLAAKSLRQSSAASRGARAASRRKCAARNSSCRQASERASQPASKLASSSATGRKHVAPASCCRRRRHRRLRLSDDPIQLTKRSRLEKRRNAALIVPIVSP